MLATGFANIGYVPFPCLCMLFQPITFGLVTPNKYVNVLRSSAHFKLVVQAKPFYGFDIIRVNDHNNFRGFGVIPTFWSELF